MKSGKIWGTQESIYNSSIQVDKININKGGFCSKHYHATKNNLFYVISGELKIIEYKNGFEDETILKSGACHIVESNIYHMFEAISNTEAIEIYFSELKNDDIIRMTEGGIKCL